MPSLRPQHRRGNGAVGVTLMRSANQFNNARRLAQSGGVREPHALRRHPSPRPQHPNETPRDGKIRTSCMIRGVCAAKRSLRGKIFARCIPERRFAGHFGYMARESCQSQLILDAWRRYVARKGRFSRPRHLLGYMKRKTCHGLPPGNAPGRNIAIARHPRTHRGVTESGDATRTKHRPIQHRMLTRPRNHENILVPSAKKRR